MIEIQPEPAKADAVSDTVAATVLVLRERFGADTLNVAETQASMASDSSLASWAEIVERLRG